MNSDMKKKELGQYFTKGFEWLQPQIIDYINKCMVNLPSRTVLDPFAGNGDILESLKGRSIVVDNFIGIDIDEGIERWKHRDSLVNIEKTNGIVITNPPYFGKTSIMRHRKDNLVKYFDGNKYQDLYQLAIQRVLESHEYAVMIIPENFILTPIYLERVRSITVIEDEIFKDTTCPICVVCFGPPSSMKNVPAHIKIYKNKSLYGSLEKLGDFDKTPNPTGNRDLGIAFNDPSGQLSLRGIDGTSRHDRMRFCLTEELEKEYDLDRIKISSRAISVIRLRKIYTREELVVIIEKANKILEEYRQNTWDLLMAPFKGNLKTLRKRRRRIHFTTARAILEEVFGAKKKPIVEKKYLVKKTIRDI